MTDSAPRVEVRRAGWVAPVTRIVLRYLGAILIALGVSEDLAATVSDFVLGDPDILLAVEVGIGAGLTLAAEVVGGLMVAGAELWFAFAKKRGWAT